MSGKSGKIEPIWKKKHGKITKDGTLIWANITGNK
jgi:hypothetical protein